MNKNRGTGLRSPGLFGEYPVIGFLMFLVGGGVFAALAIALQTHNPLLLQTDTQLINDLHTVALHSVPLIVGLTILGYYVGEEVIVVIGVLLAVYFLYKRYWTELWMVLLAWGGEGAIWWYLAFYFDRPRPVFATQVWHQMTVPGFPSGHVFAAVLCYGLLAYLIVPKLSSRFWKAVVIALAVLITLYVGFSRLFVGDHYPSDILAGYALGIAWGGLVYTVVEQIALNYRQRRKATS